MPLRTSLRRMLRSANEADWPAAQPGTWMRLRSMERIFVGVNAPVESGPMRTWSPLWTMPDLTTPETTVPTKGTEKVSLTWNSSGAVAS